MGPSDAESDSIGLQVRTVRTTAWKIIGYNTSLNRPAAGGGRGAQGVCQGGCRGGMPVKRHRRQDAAFTRSSPPTRPC